MDEDTKRFLIACADTAASRWREKDQGIWEVRGDPQHFLYCKVMCWVALDRAINLAHLLGAGDRVDRWKASRDEIWQNVVRDGWSESAGAFTQCVGSTALDASVQPDDADRRLPARGRPADARHLRRDRAAAHRRAGSRTGTAPSRAWTGYLAEEGTFLLCTVWLAQTLAQSGQVERAKAVFQTAAAFVNDVGLLAEEVDQPPASCSATFRKPSATSA